MPSFAVRAAFDPAFAMPFWRNQSLAFSMSPFVASRARLESIIPAPVASRSALTWSAEMAMLFLVVQGLVLIELGLVDGRHAGESFFFLFLFGFTDRKFGHRGFGRGHKLLRTDQLARFQGGVGDLRGDQLDGTDRVVVPGDDVIDLVGITV